jgi:hypothetical protein
MWTTRHDETYKFLTKKTSFLPRQISTPSVLWRLLFSRGRGARNRYGNDSFDNRYRSGKSARMGCPRRGRLGTQGCHAGRRVVTYQHSPLQGQEDPHGRGASHRASRLLPLRRHAGSRPQHQQRRRTPRSLGRQMYQS